MHLGEGFWDDDGDFCRVDYGFYDKAKARFAKPLGVVGVKVLVGSLLDLSLRSFSDLLAHV